MHFNFVKDIPFEPQGIFKSGHWQTVYSATFWKPKAPPRGKCIKIRVADNASLLCEYNPVPEAKGCLLLVHGLEGCAQSPYILSTAYKALQAGYSVMRFNMRGCGGTTYLSETLYHAGLSQDLLTVLEYIESHLGYTKTYVAGFSLGANLVLKLAGHHAHVLPKSLKGAVAVSPPLDLLLCTESLHKPSNLIYERYYYLRMRKTFQMRHRYFKHKPGKEFLKQVKNLRDFDRQITAKEFGYRDLEHYLIQESSGRYLSHIQRPTLIIHAQDDPVIPFSAFQGVRQKVGPQTQVLVTQHGGHVGFINRKGIETDQLWAENRLMEFIEGL